MKSWAFQNMANFVTGLRLILCVCIIVDFIISRTVNWWVIMIIAISAAFTDFIDGYLARRFHITSQVGAQMDKIADKLLICPLALFLVYLGMPRNVPELVLVWSWGVVIVLVAIDIFLFFVGTILYCKGVDIKANEWGKRKMTAECVVFLSWVFILCISPPVMKYAIYFIDIAVMATIFLASLSLDGYWTRYQEIKNMSLAQLSNYVDNAPEKPKIKRVA